MSSSNAKFRGFPRGSKTDSADGCAGSSAHKSHIGVSIYHQDSVTNKTNYKRCNVPGNHFLREKKKKTWTYMSFFFLPK